MTRDEAEGLGGVGGRAPALSVVAPAHNERDNIRALVDEVERALAGVVDFEFVIVDDGSTDDTQAVIREMMRDRSWLRCVVMRETPTARGVAGGGGGGQSAAFHAAFRACRGERIAVLDADLQNDPADIPRLLRLMDETKADVVQGDRSHARKDNVVRRVGSIVGRSFRRWLLGDTIRDTGCSLRVMRREVALKLPLEFKGMHRFIPVTARHLGYTVVETRVTHRARMAGETKYGMGIVQRALPGLIDLFAVRYMRSRRRPVSAAEIGAGDSSAAAEESRSNEAKGRAAGAASGGVR
ncbi:MAG: glycosyltransferase family 2 protein [Phycisphaerales bacterium]